MNIDLKHFHIFAVLADNLHFGRAAEKLNMAQPQLSRTLQFIEGEIGCPLLTRSTRGVQLTPAGEIFLAESRSVLERARQAIQTTRDTHEGIAGNVNVAYMDFAISKCLPDVLRSFHQRFDRIKINLHHVWTEQQKIRLLDREIDMGFLIGPFENPEIKSIEVSHDRLMLILPDTHYLAKNAEIDLAALSDAHFIFGNLSAWRPYRDVVEDICLEHGFVPKIIDEPFNSDAILGLVAAGLGLTIYPERPSSMYPRGVVAKPISNVTKHVTTVAAWHRGNPSKALSNLIEIVAEYSKTEKALRTKLHE